MMTLICLMHVSNLYFYINYVKNIYEGYMCVYGAHWAFFVRCKNFLCFHRRSKIEIWEFFRQWIYSTFQQTL